MADEAKPLPFFAFGNVAVGFIAVGNVAIGVVAIGFSVAIGPIAIGMNAIGWLAAFGLNAVGSVAFAAINGIGLVTFAGVNGLGAVLSSMGVNHGVVPALAPVLGGLEAIAAYLVRPPPAPGIPTVSLATLLDGGLDAGEVEARLLALEPGRGVLEHRGREVPIEVPDVALAGEGEDGPTRALQLGKTPRVRVRLLVERRVTARDDGYRASGKDDRILVAQSLEVSHRPSSLRGISAVTLAVAAVLSVLALFVGIAR